MLVVEVVEVVYNVRVEDLKQLEVDGLRVAQGLDGVEVGEVLEIEVGGVGEGGLEGAQGQLLGLGGRDVLGGECSQRTEEVCVGLLVLAGGRSRVADRQVQLALLLGLNVPGL